MPKSPTVKSQWQEERRNKRARLQWSLGSLCSESRKDNGNPTTSSKSGMGNCRSGDSVQIIDDVKEKLKVTKVIFVIGGPGSGKGSQCVKMVEKYGFTHLSTGNLLRKEISNETERGKIIQKIMIDGGLVPLTITLELLREAMLENLQETKGFMIDGYPRTLKQAETFDKLITPPSLVLLIDCSPETMKQRLISRGETSGRFDDNEVTISKRVENYLIDSVPVVKHYESKGLLREIQGEGTEDEVFQNVSAILDEL